MNNDTTNTRSNKEIASILNEKREGGNHASIRLTPDEANSIRVSLRGPKSKWERINSLCFQRKGIVKGAGNDVLTFAQAVNKNSVVLNIFIAK